MSQQTHGVSSQPPHVSDMSATHAVRQARSQLSDNGGSFSSDFGPFQCLKIGVPSGCLGETSIFKIMIDDLTSWSKLESTW